MTSFKDKKGTAWDIELNVGTARKLNSRLSLNFLPAAIPGGGKEDETPAWVGALVRVGEDPGLLADALWTLCERSAEARGIGPDEFAERLDGDAARAAADAIAAEVVNFSHPAIRPILRDAVRGTAPEPAPAPSTPPSGSAPGS